MKAVSSRSTPVITSTSSDRNLATITVLPASLDEPTVTFLLTVQS
ncbi:MAG TPA: hypothetical protein V6D09_25775 [Leptolyngbyaceae cyanobacterium]